MSAQVVTFRDGCLFRPARSDLLLREPAAIETVAYASRTRPMVMSLKGVAERTNCRKFTIGQMTLGAPETWRRSGSVVRWTEVLG